MPRHRWLAGFFIIVFCVLGLVASLVIYIDPFFHFHPPHCDRYYYVLDNERYQNDGITRHFDYDAVVTGTSMVENSDISQINTLFEVNSVKVCYAGASYKEINDSLVKAFEYNDSIRAVFRGLDLDYILDSADHMRYEEYPDYLYDDNPLNDVKYIFLHDAVGRSLKTLFSGSERGITDFDHYCSWGNDDIEYGLETVMPQGFLYKSALQERRLSDEDRAVIFDNIEMNICRLADEYPDTVFYYYFTPYSVVYHMGLIQAGEYRQHIEAEEYAVELILDHDNIRLYSFNNCHDITTNLDNYKDEAHYGPWINSEIYQMIDDDECRLTKENYQEYIREEYSYYMTYDYESLNDQR